MSHTRGPMEIARPGPGQTMWRVTTPNGLLLACFNREPDARLFAKAWELLEKSKALADEMQDHDNSSDFYTWSDHSGNLYDLMKIIKELEE